MTRAEFERNSVYLARGDAQFWARSWREYLATLDRALVRYLAAR